MSEEEGLLHTAYDHKRDNEEGFGHVSPRPHGKRPQRFRPTPEAQDDQNRDSPERGALRLTGEWRALPKSVPLDETAPTRFSQRSA